MTQQSIDISIDDQQLRLIEDGTVKQAWPVSTALKGAGCQDGSHRTPVGRFRIAEKIGAGQPSGTRFRGREPIGVWDGRESGDDMILSRILWLEGLDPENANTRDRYIYIHGTNHEDRLGRPCSLGCVRMANRDIIELYDLIGEQTEVTIQPPSRPRENLIFFDCDSTLSTIEGIDELARANGPEVFARVEALTHAAMNGEVPVEEVFGKRLELIRPDRGICDTIARRYIDTMTDGSRELIQHIKERGWRPVILSGGFAPLIEPLAEELGVEHVEAVPLYLDEEGRYLGFGEDYPTTRDGGKPEIIREWKQALLPRRTIMVGDGNSDLESSAECDLFVGYGGVVAREKVKEGADVWITSLHDFPLAALD